MVLCFDNIDTKSIGIGINICDLVPSITWYKLKLNFVVGLLLGYCLLLPPRKRFPKMFTLSMSTQQVCVCGREGGRPGVQGELAHKKTKQKKKAGLFISLDRNLHLFWSSDRNNHPRWQGGGEAVSPNKTGPPLTDTKHLSLPIRSRQHHCRHQFSFIWADYSTQRSAAL